MLYIFGRETRARTSLREILFGRRNAGVLRGRHGRPAPREEEYRSLAGWFGHASGYQKLCDFIIARYGQEWAVLLIDLVAHQFFLFREWLLREGRPVHGAPRSPR